MKPRGERRAPLSRVAVAFPIDLRALDKLAPERLVDATRALAGVPLAPRARKELALVSPQLAEPLRRAQCAARALATVEALLSARDWPAETRRSVQLALSVGDPGAVTHIYLSPRFEISYQTEGPWAVDPDASSQPIAEPGVFPAVVLATLAAGGAPSYVRRLGFWLERALDVYLGPAFGMRDPAALNGGRIPVTVWDGEPGAIRFQVHMGRDHHPDLLCALAAHEVFHLAQYCFDGRHGDWNSPLFEGGAVFAEDAVAGRLNRYIYEAGVTVFNNLGLLAAPDQPLVSAAYKGSLFWRYLGEQAAPAGGPAPVAWTAYTSLLVAGEGAGVQSTDTMKTALATQLPEVELSDFRYVGADRADLVSSETVMGNFALACRLKDQIPPVGDRRFAFLENLDASLFWQVFPGEPAPAVDHMAPVARTAASLGPADPPLRFDDDINPFAQRFYEIEIDPAIPMVDVGFRTAADPAACRLHVALLDGSGRLRDIHRVDAATWTKRIANLVDPAGHFRLAAMVSGTEEEDSYRLTVARAAASPDVMITRWNSAVRTEYEQHPDGWTWTSPDLWVGDDPEAPDARQVVAGREHVLSVRLHNKGLAGGTGIGVAFHAQDATGGPRALAPGAWQPIADAAGQTPALVSLALAPAASGVWTVKWAVPAGPGPTHLCVRAVVSSAGDPNADNKRAMAIFAVRSAVARLAGETETGSA